MTDTTSSSGAVRGTTRVHADFHDEVGDDQAADTSDLDDEAGDSDGRSDDADEGDEAEPRSARRICSARARSPRTTSRVCSTSSTSMATSMSWCTTAGRWSRWSGRASTTSSAPAGATLEALQELSRLAVYRRTGGPSRLLLDVGGFRAARRKELGRGRQERRRTGQAAWRVRAAGAHVRVRAQVRARRHQRHGRRGASPRASSRAAGSSSDRLVDGPSIDMR